jgi:two-component system cell cycle response regulator
MMVKHSVSDPLTGLFNRRYFDIAVQREAEWCSQRSETASVLLLNLGGCNAVKDGDGHWAGHWMVDRVLEMVGRALRRRVRQGDVACRCGGDEFALLLPNTPVTQAQRVAERIRADVAASVEQTDICGRRVNLTVNIDVTSLPDGGPAREPLLTRADRAWAGSR